MSAFRFFKNSPVDRSLIVAIIFLLGLGIVQVYSSSFIFAIESFDDGLFFVRKQALFVATALLVLAVTTYMPWKWLERSALALWALAFAGLVLTLVPGFGVKVGGATRWLNLGGGLRLEPSEILKYTYPVMLAFLMPQSEQGERRSTKMNFVMLILAAAPLAILLKQPDFGSFAILTVVAFGLLFSRGLNWTYVFGGVGSLVVAFYFLIVRYPYRMARVTAFLDPWSDPAQKGFQVIQSMLGFYSGGLTGVGLGQGQGKLFFLPEAHTDFTLSVLGEELGFIGMAAVLLIFGYVTLRGLQISVKVKNPREQVVALGVSLTFALTSFINAGVAMGLLPTKGLGMPFLSYGGSVLISTCFGLGLLLNIERRSRAEVPVSTVNRSFIKIRD